VRDASKHIDSTSKKRVLRRVGMFRCPKYVVLGTSAWGAPTNLPEAQGWNNSCRRKSKIMGVFFVLYELARARAFERLVRTNLRKIDVGNNFMQGVENKFMQPEALVPKSGY
jgi:hypothetical protein